MSAVTPSDELIQRIYDAALDVEAWDTVLQALTVSLRAAHASLAFRPANPKARGVYRSPTLSRDALEDYDRRLLEFPEMLTRLQRAPEGAIVRTPQMAPLEAFRRSALYREWGRPLGVEWGIASTILKDDAGVGFIGILGESQRGDFSAGDARWLAQFVPHMQRALHLQRTLDFLRLERSALHEVLERLPRGVILMDQRGQMLHASRVAQRILAAGDGLWYSRYGLRAFSAADTDALCRAVHQASALDPGAVRDLKLMRPSQRRPLEVSISPLGRDTAAIWHVRRPSVAVFVNDPADRPGLDEECLRTLYDFTPAEARLAGLLGAGESVIAAARRLGITRASARKRLQVLFLKTDTHRQAELVELLLRGPAGLQHD